MSTIQVAGEDVDLLVEVFRRVKFEKSRNGMSEFSLEVESRLGEALQRAVMRIEAELMLDDADRLGRPGYEARTHTQRAADAFVALAIRVGDAIAHAESRG